MCKQQLLVISPFTAYKNIKHAGGKIHYYYLSKIENYFDITIISIANEQEKDDIKNTIIKNKNSYIFYKNKKLNKISYIKHFFWQRNPFDKYAGFIDYDTQCFFYKVAKQLKQEKYQPNIILLDWTQSIFLSKKIHRLFPNSTIICIEQDVTFLKYKRFFEKSDFYLKKKINKHKYQNIKKQELNSLKYATQIITLNHKDTELLESELKNNLKIKTIVPYFDKYIHITRKKINPNIIYFGAMSRPENYNSAIWFIQNVLPLLPSYFKFIVIGNAPAKELLNLKNDRIEITGFVNDITSYFESALCIAAPIVMGAGIKIKILEAMSAGLPVITNDIGIEGIPAENLKHYIHCTYPEEFVTNIIKLYNDHDFNLLIGNNARNFIQNNFNYENCSYI